MDGNLFLMKNYSSFLFFYLFKFFFLYIEKNQLLCISKLGSFKCKFDLSFFFYNHNSTFLFKLFILNFFLLSNNNKKYTNKKIIFQIFISFFLISIFTGFRAKFKIHGRGYKLHKKNNNLIFKLGYSHLIFKTLDLGVYLKRKDKKKMFYTLISSNYYLLTNTINKFRSYRIPNIYSRKGILNNTKKILFKIGKLNMV
jgi:ribosomal protein L6P/L9E